MATPRSVNIVIPCYNEEHRLPTQEIIEFSNARPWLRFTVVDDGSTDATRDILLDLARRSEGRIEALILSENGGKAEAVRQGFQFAFKGPHWAVGYWDADLATPLLDIEDFTRRLKNHPRVDLVIGSRVQLLGRHINRNPQRHYFGRVAATAASTVLGLNVYDTQCGAKLFRVNDRTKGIFQDPFRSRWIFDVEILARWKAALMAENHSDPTHHIMEVPLETWTDVDGSKLSMRDMASAPIELARIYWHYRRVLK